MFYVFYIMYIFFIDIVDKSGSSTIYMSQTQGYPWSSSSKLPATESFPDPVYSWRKQGGSVLKEDRRISISKGGHLYIANVQTSDVATYTSSVSNTVTGGSYNRNPISLSVRSKLTFTDTVT